MFGKKEIMPGMATIPVKGMNVFIFLGFLILGAYFVNFPFNFMKVPEFVLQYNAWIIFAGGIFMLLGALYYFKSKRR